MSTEPCTNNGNEQTMYNERLTFYHANGQGNGAAVQFEPRVNQRPGDRYNCFFLDMARQKTIAARNGTESTSATFDWENKITVKLGFADICEFLSVLEHDCDRAGGKCDGLYHQSGDTNTLIRFARHESGGIALSLSRKTAGSDQPNRIGTVLSRAEAVGLRNILKVSLFFITFPTAVMGVRT